MPYCYMIDSYYLRDRWVSVAELRANYGQDTPFQQENRSMQMTDAHSALLVRWEAAFGLPSLDNEDARNWTRRLAEQFAYEFPNQGWCHKSASPTRPPSTDVIAREANGFWGYDIIVMQGSPSQTFEFNPQPMDIRGQTPIYVQPVNHLGISAPEPPYPPPGGDLEVRVTALERQVSAQQQILGKIEAWIRSYR